MTDLAPKPARDTRFDGDVYGGENTARISESSTAKVTDWATDFDHGTPEYAENAIGIWDELRGTCPIAHTNRYGGAWLPTRHEDVSTIAYDTTHFTSQSVVVSNLRPGPDALPRPIGVAPPITSDPPFHMEARRLLLPAFAPKKIADLEESCRELCRTLLDEIGDASEFDASLAFAAHIPPTVIAKMLGFPPEDLDYFLEIVKHTLEDIAKPGAERIENSMRTDAYLEKQINEHLDNPRDDLTTFLLEAELGGQKLDPRHVGGTMILLLVAGIDTTWSAIGASLWHLAQNPHDLERLVNEPELMDTAVEEFLRAYAPVTMARLVAEDVEIGGCPMKADDWVLLPFPAANRDPAVFDRADDRHSAFGLGIHRCIGSNLARLELKVAIEEFIKRYPKFELQDPKTVRWAAGQVRGPRELPVRVIK
jgi:cytochrome P450